MKEIRVLIAGESWIIVTTEIKGFDQFTTSGYEEGVGWLQNALDASGIRVDFLPNHLASTKFPSELESLKSYDVIILSDIGSNTLLLHPDTFIHSKPTPNRLDLLEVYVKEGGGFLMIGGYMSFTGFAGKAKYKGTSIEKTMPVSLISEDDRVEVPQGFSPLICKPEHPILKNISGPWPILLGYNRVCLKPNASLILSHDGDPISAVWEYNQGRSGVFTSDCAPHWGSPEFVSWAGYKTFFSQLVRWLAKEG